MRLVRLVLAVLLTLVLPVHGFAAATMRLGIPPAPAAASGARHAPPAADVKAGATPQAQPAHGAPGGRTMACCQPALVAGHRAAVTRVAAPGQPFFAARPVSSWSEPVPRKPPRP